MQTTVVHNVSWWQQELNIAHDTDDANTWSLISHMERSYFHLSESQRVVIASPKFPLHTITVRRLVASQVETVQVGIVTTAVPPATFVLYSTWAIEHVVVLVSSAELVSKMTPRPQRVTFKQQVNIDTAEELQSYYWYYWQFEVTRCRRFGM